MAASGRQWLVVGGASAVRDQPATLGHAGVHWAASLERSHIVLYAYVTDVTDVCNGQCTVQINYRAVMKCINAINAHGNALDASGSRYKNVACTAQKTDPVFKS